MLDEPTNHLDVEARRLARASTCAARRGALLAVTHDRWFLDAVCTDDLGGRGRRPCTRYEGGYAAYVLARAERERQSAASEDRRQNLLRKELAWLRRGPPARTSQAAGSGSTPPTRSSRTSRRPRDRSTLQKFATARLGKQVFDLEDVSLAPAPGAAVLDPPADAGGSARATGSGCWASNGAGKTTLLRLLAGARR